MAVCNNNEQYVIVGLTSTRKPAPDDAMTAVNLYELFDIICYRYFSLPDYQTSSDGQRMLRSTQVLINSVTRYLG